MKNSILPVSNGLKDKLRHVTTPNDAQKIVAVLVHEGNENLGFEAIFKEREFPFKIPLYYLPEVEGMKMLLTHIGIEYKLPEVIDCGRL